MGKNNILNTYNRFEPTFVRGKGVYAYDETGKEYIDFVAGVAVNCLGHCNPKIIEAIKNQSEQLIHISNLYWNDNQINLAKRLAELGDLEKTFFCNSGTEAAELALKISRKFGKTFSDEKNKIIYMKNSFHGRTMGALSVTGQKKYQDPYRPLIGGVVECEYNNIEDFISKMDENVCGVILEVIQGEGGIVSVEKDFLNKIRELCDSKGALLIFDEVQCGAGRLGTYFAYQKFGVIPDIITMAKGLGGGFPIGAVLTRGQAAEIMVPGDHGATFGGNPLACAVALAILDELIEGGIVAEVDKKSEYVKSKLEKMMAKYSVIEKINGMGLLLGIKLKDELETKVLVGKAFEKGLMLVGAGNNVVRLVPPLNVTYEELDKALQIIEEVLGEV
jgi:acetylornithine/N-succinyldiaminopimelate aminotransferase